MSEICQAMPDWAKGAIVLGFLAWEYWLGKTTLIHPGSTLELLIFALKKLVSFFPDRELK